MPKLKVLGSKELIKIFAEFGFSIRGYKGSHITVQRIMNDIVQELTVPGHKEIAKGTLKAIYSQAARFIPIEELRKYFYTK